MHTTQYPTVISILAKIAQSIGLTLWAQLEDQEAIASLDGLEVSESSFDEWVAASGLHASSRGALCG